MVRARRRASLLSLRVALCAALIACLTARAYPRAPAHTRHTKERHECVPPSPHTLSARITPICTKTCTGTPAQPTELTHSRPASFLHTLTTTNRRRSHSQHVARMRTCKTQLCTHCNGTSTQHCMFQISMHGTHPHASLTSSSALILASASGWWGSAPCSHRRSPQRRRQPAWCGKLVV
jgi:hypothetical protein